MPRSDSIQGRRAAPTTTTITPTTTGREAEVFEGGGLQTPLIDPVDLLAGFIGSKFLSLGKTATESALQPKKTFPPPKPATATAPAKIVEPVLEDTRGLGQFYHGTSRELENVSSTHYSGRNVYGEGFYTTDDLVTAQRYQKKGAKAAGERLNQNTYRVVERQPTLFYDLDAPITKEAKTALDEVAEYSESVGEAVADLESGRIKSLGEAFDVARGASHSLGESADSLTEAFGLVQERLRKYGFGGFTHIGGKLTKSPRRHQVKIYWEPETQVAIERVKK